MLAELLRRDPPLRELSDDQGRRDVLVEQPDGDDLVRLAFGELRRAATSQPTVCIYLLEALHLLREGLEASSLSTRTGVLVEQADLVVAGCERASVLPTDLDDVRRAHHKRFGASVRATTPDHYAAG